MARPKSSDKRRAILDAATRIIVKDGLSASTAAIAKEARISNGSLFTYFETKAALFNQLYLELKREMAAAALDGFPAKAALRKQAFHFWSKWMDWATTTPEKRRALAQLAISDQITPETRAAGHEIMADIIQLMERVKNNGSLREAPMPFVGALMNSLADTTMDFMINHPTDARNHCVTGFKTFWRAVS